MPIGERIKTLRKEAKLDQDELGAKIDVSGAAVGGYERGIRKPSIDTLRKLCHVFNVSSDYLLGMSNDPNISAYGDQKPVELEKILYEQKQLLFEGVQLSDLDKRRIIDLVHLVFADSRQKQNRDQ